MWNKCEVTFSLFIGLGVEHNHDSISIKDALNAPGRLPEGWSAHRVEPNGRSYDVVFRVDGLNVTYEAGRHVQRSLEQLRLR